MFQSSSKVGLIPHFAGLEFLSSNCENALYKGAGNWEGFRLPGFSILRSLPFPVLEVCVDGVSPVEGARLVQERSANGLSLR